MIDHQNFTDTHILFPDNHQEYGFDEKILATTFNHVRHRETADLPWSLKGVIPTTEFYQTLHHFLKKWPISRVATKIDIARCYMAIDRHLRYEGARPDNIYRFIENTSKHPGDLPMSCRKDKPTMSTHVVSMQQNSSEVETLNSEITALKKELQESSKQLCSAQAALKDVTNQVHVLKKQRDCAREKVHHYKGVQESLLEDLAEIHEEYCDLSKEMAALEQELSSVTDKGDECSQELMSAAKRREGASNCTNHLLSNHTFSKTPNMVKRMGLR